MDLNLLNKSDKEFLDEQLNEYHSNNNDSIKIKKLLKITYHFDSGLRLNYLNKSNEILEFQILNKSSNHHHYIVKCLALIKHDIALDMIEAYDYNKAISLLDSSENLLKSIKENKILPQIISTKSVLYYEIDSLDLSIKLSEKCIDIFKENKDTTSMIESYNILGQSYYIKEDLYSAIKYFQKQLTLAEKIDDSIYFANSKLNIGQVYYDLGLLSQAKKYIESSLEIYSIKNSDNESQALIDLAIIFSDVEDFKKSNRLLKRSLDLSIVNFDDHNQMLSYLALSYNFYSQEKIDSAIYFSNQAINIAQEVESDYFLIHGYSDLSTYYLELNDFKTAKYYNDIVLNLPSYQSYPNLQIDALYNSYKINKNSGKIKKALNDFELLTELEDSIELNQNSISVIQNQAQYEFDKQKTIDSIKYEQNKKLKDSQIIAQQSQIKQDRTLKIALLVGVLFLLFFGGFMVNRFLITKKQKKIIFDQKLKVEQQNEIVQCQKDEIEEAHKEITDSIAYAKRIQSAILPPIKLVKSYLHESFVLYKPKDVVAGDFYWMYPNTSDGSTLFAAADCTGHGVPGAMVSVICNSALNRAVKEFKLSEPGEVLTKTRELVIEEFEKSDEEVKDGMDIALCSLKGYKLKYSGAYNALYLIRNGSSEVEEIKAHKQAIGLVENPLPFPTHEIELNDGDSFYIFSDGYVDQFGGDKGKKFKAPSFRKLLLSIQNKGMEEQKSLIDNAFETWRGDLEQIDDVCVIGVRV